MGFTLPICGLPSEAIQLIRNLPSVGDDETADCVSDTASLLVGNTCKKRKRYILGISLHNARQKKQRVTNTNLCQTTHNFSKISDSYRATIVAYIAKKAY